MKLLPKITPQNRDQRRAEMYRRQLRSEAVMGGKLFGPIPAGHRREFFCLDDYTWVWHEEWTDAQGAQRVMTTRYDIRPNGVIKSQGNNIYQKVTGDELKNLYQAGLMYYDKLNSQLAAMQR